MNTFDSVSVVVPVTNEVLSLRRSIETILDMSFHDIAEIIVVASPNTTHQSREACTMLERQFPGKIRNITQELPYLGGAVRMGFSLAKSTHVGLLFSDCESDPGVFQQLINAARENPDSIISASRWMEGGQMEEYPKLKLICNFLGQVSLGLLYTSSVSDFTFGYRIWPRSILESFSWECCSHAFVLETIVKPILSGVVVREVPAVWRARTEGKSNMNMIFYFSYLFHGVRWKVSNEVHKLRTVCKAVVNAIGA